MADHQERLPVTHCPHGTYLRDHICMSCIRITGHNNGHCQCTNCGVSGNWEWAEDHGENCAGLRPTEARNELPF